MTMCYWKYEDHTSHRASSELIRLFIIFATSFQDYLLIIVTSTPVNIQVHDAQWRSELQKETWSPLSANCGVTKETISSAEFTYSINKDVTKPYRREVLHKCTFGFPAFQYQKNVKNRLQ
jgi:hypothetical protein